MSTTRNRRLLLIESTLWSIYANLTVAYITPFALLLGAGTALIGLIQALPQATMMISQYPGTRLLQRLGRRKPIVLFFPLASKLIWLPVAGLALLAGDSVKLNIFVALLAASWFLVSLASPAWTSFMADVVPERIRGRFFARRDLLITVVGTVVFWLAAAWLDLAPARGVGFASIFVLGLGLGLWGLWYRRKMREPVFSNHRAHFVDYFRGASRPFNRFLRFTIAFYFAYSIAGPFFIVYILRELGVSYTIMASAFVLGAAVRAVAGLHWGRVTDRFGDKPVTLLGTLGTAAVPFSYLFITPGSAWLIFPVEIISAIVWAAFDRGHFNLLLDLTKPGERPLRVAEFNMLSSMPLIAAPIVGGFIAERGALLLTGIPLVFAISVLFRLASATLLLNIKEPRIRPEAPFRHVFREAFHVHPMRGVEHAIRVVLRRMRGPATAAARGRGRVAATTTQLY